MSLSQAAEMLGASLGGEDREFDSVSTDSRTLDSGALFVALRGERFDGNEFIDQAMARGAAGVLSDRPARDEVPTIEVDDSLDALQKLAAGWRRRFTCPLVGVTGSNGKTTVKEMLGAILSRRAPTLVSAGNLNNHIGVPLSLLRLRAEHRFAVIEMGMNHAGELTLLSRLAAPTVALVNNAAPAHLEGLGTVERVAEAKGEIYSGLGDDGIAVVNAGDAFADYWLGINRHRRILTFAFDTAADVHGSAVTGVDHSLLDIDFGDARVSLRLPVGGAHNARNAVAAAAAAFALDVTADEIAEGLESFVPVAGRSEVVRLEDGAVLINDTYNANPASLAAAVDMLSRYEGTRVLVMGDMGELGPNAAEFHRQAGRAAAQAGIERLLALGPQSRLACDVFGAGAQAFDDVDALVEALSNAAGSEVTILVKGSRAMRMERVSAALRARGAGRAD